MKTERKRLVIVAVVATVLGSAGVGLLHLRIHQTSDHPYSRVEAGLYLGSSMDRPPPGTQAVVNLCGRPDPYQVGPSLWAPMYEAGPDVAEEKATLNLLRRVVGFIVEQRRAGRTTYVHCLLGQNRSGAVVTAYLMQEHGMGRDKALAFLQQQRPIVQPDPTLMKLLSDWEQVLKASPLSDPIH
jgi:Dual specificity phosphatase, catalytic domain